jgi:phosphate starvation-inducible protein PhoH and related proteins
MDAAVGAGAARQAVAGPSRAQAAAPGAAASSGAIGSRAASIARTERTQALWRPASRRSGYHCRRGARKAPCLRRRIAKGLTAQRSVDLGELSDRLRLFGEYDRNLSAIESSLDVAVEADGDRLLLAGEDAAVARAEEVVRRVLEAAVAGAHITPDDVALALSAAHIERGTSLPSTLLRSHRGREVRPRTAGQHRFVRSIEESTLTFGIGPAGTGKTYLAVVMAVRALKRRDVARVVLSRPAVEAGERLGFLPGDLREKFDPYMRPLFDVLAELLDDAVVNKYMERGTLEVAPLAFMRGRTLSDCFVILDEAQNATDDQLKMFLTRLGSGSKMVVAGDVTQIDLPTGQRSGLRSAAGRLSSIEDVGVVELDDTDVVRHPLVAKIVRAYAAGVPPPLASR